jgi:hypothetical protein
LQQAIFLAASVLAEQEDSCWTGILYPYVVGILEEEILITYN